MKAVRFIGLVILMSLAAGAFAQGHEHETPKAKAAPGGAQKAFSIMKSLAGEWEGKVTTDMPIAASVNDKPLHVSMRVMSRGNVLVHEFQEAGTPLDPEKYDHPVTMLYVDSNQLNLVHYCDAGNRPRMTGKMSSDEKKIDFDFAELGGSNKFGHMHEAAFTIIDEDHHVEQWKFVLADGTVVNARFDLRRVK